MPIRLDESFRKNATRCKVNCLSMRILILKKTNEGEINVQ